MQRLPHRSGSQSWPRAIIREEKGSVIILFALAMAALIGFMAISLDAGLMYSTRAKMANIADASALAGANFLPEHPLQAYQTAIDTAVMNGVQAEDVLVSITENDTKVDVVLRGPAELRFANVGGSKKVNIPADSAGAIEVVTGVFGAQPFGIEKSDMVYGQMYAIKLGADFASTDLYEPYRGNFHALALGQTGASQYEQFVENGYPGLLTVGQQLDTEPGNMAGPTRQGLAARMNAAPSETWQNYSLKSPRILFIPIVNTFQVNGRDVVQIMGFGAFFLEDFKEMGQGQVRGRFMRYHTEGRVTTYSPGIDYGLRSVKLVK